jgi:hypothetical protein
MIQTLITEGLKARTWSPSDPGLHGCVCCAPALQTLGLLSLPHLAAAGRPDGWKRLGAPTPVPAGAVILANARILTVDEAFSTAQALAFRDGRILAVGTLDAVREAAGEDAEVLDAEGRTVLPGFIEPHMHFFAIAMFGTIPDVGAVVCTDADAVIARLGDMAAAAPDGEWIVARQFDPSLQAGADRITRHTLDQIAPRNPVFLFNASLHIAYCNSRALEIAGVSAATQDPPGASYVRDSSGAPNGVLQGQAAMFSVLGHNLAAMATDDIDDSPNRHTPGTHSLRLRNLPVAMARGAPATQTTLTQLIWQHTGIATFNARTGHRRLTRRRDFAYAFMEVHTIDDGEALIHSAPNIMTNRVHWEEIGRAHV